MVSCIRIQVSIEGEEVRTRFTYDAGLVASVKSVPGRRYDEGSRTWLIPAPQWCRFKDAATRLGAEFTIRDEDMDALIALENPTFPPIGKVDGFKGELYPFQADAVGFLISRKHCLLADDMGLGKTVCCIAAFMELRNRGLAKRVLVLCPKTIVAQWMNEYKRFMGEEAYGIVGNRLDREAIIAQIMGKQDYLTPVEKGNPVFLAVTNYETVLRQGELLEELKPDVVVVDEAQRIGSFDAQTTKAIKDFFGSVQYRWALTGTPIENALQELHSIMEWVDRGVLGPWWIFSRNHIIYGGYRDKQVIGYRKLEDVHVQLRGWMLRRRKRDVLGDLPPVTVNNYYVQLDTEERSMYALIRSHLEEYYQVFRQSRGAEGGGQVLAQLMYMRECCDHLSLISGENRSSKLAELMNIIRDLGDAKAVIFTEFESMLQIISRNVEVEHTVLYGAMSDRERVLAINSFTENPGCQLFISTEAGGLGVNLQVASVVVNYELHWNPARFQQRVARLHRIGQKGNVTCINLIAENTVEEHILRVLAEKTDLFRKVVDGDFVSLGEEKGFWHILAREFGTVTEETQF